MLLVADNRFLPVCSRKAKLHLYDLSRKLSVFMQGNKQSIYAVVRSTPSHCAGVHTVCGEGAQGTFIKSVRFVCVWVNSKCAVREKW